MLTVQRVLGGVSLLILVASVIACGGGKMEFSPDLSGGGSRGTGQVFEGSLKVQPHYTYDFNHYPTTEGFTVVPLEQTSNGYLPSDARTRYEIALKTSTTAGGPIAVSLSASAAPRLLTHLRYDPQRWRVEGVGTLNTWSSEDFVSGAFIEEPGVLVVHSVPAGVGADSANSSSGEFARIFFQPADSRTPSNAPSAQDALGIIFAIEGVPPGAPTGTGEISYRMDGQLGLFSTKDGDISGTELTTISADAYLHPLMVSPTNYAQGDAWSGGAYSSASVFTFSENLIGDYDNNSEVNAADIASIAANMNTSLTYHAQRGIRDSSAGWANFFDLLDDNTVRPHGINNFNAYWYLDLWDPVIPPDYSPNPYSGPGHMPKPTTEVSNALDGNWDGFVGDWTNWDDDNDGEYESRYDDLINGLYRPGDVGPISQHFAERISGYRVYTIAHDASGYNPTAVPPTSPPIVAINAKNYYRGGIAIAPSITPTPVPYTRPYFDTTWGQYDSNKKLWKGEIDVELDESDFYSTAPSSDTNYDLLIYPYYYDGSQVLHGPCSRVSAFFSYQLDTYGPQFDTSKPVPADSSTGFGLQAASPLAAWDPNSGIEISLLFDDANDVVPDGASRRWATSNSAKPVRYQLYGSMNQQTVFNNPLTGANWTWTETDPSISTAPGNRWTMLVSFSPAEASSFNLNFEQPVFLGIRVAEDETGGLLEYVRPGGTFGPNVNTVELGAPTPGPEYGDGTGIPSNDSSGNTGIFEVVQTGQTGIVVTYYNADQVEYSGGNIVWSDEAVDYTLYASTDLQALFAPQSLVTSWQEGLEDTQIDAARRRYPQTGTYKDATLPLDSLGTIYFGIRATQPGTGIREYAGQDDPNSNPYELVVGDQSPPYFLNDFDPYGPNTTPDDNSILFTVPYDTSLAVYFKRAIDPPLYDPNAEITYRCFWAPRNIAIDPLDPAATATEVLPAKTIRYSDTQGPPFDLEQYHFLITGLSPGAGYNLYVFAEDTVAPPNRSVNLGVVTAVTTNLSNTGTPVVNNLSETAGSITGDMVADNSNVTLLYPSATVPAVYSNDGDLLFDEYALLNYQELLNGVLGSSPPETNILNSTQQQPPAQPEPVRKSYASTSQAALDFVRGLDGQPISGVAGFRQAIVSYTGNQTWTSPIWSLMTNRRTGAGTWGTPVVHTQPEETFICVSDASSVTNFNYRNATGWQNVDLLPWGVYWWQPTGQLRYKIGQNGVWNPGAFTVLDGANQYYAWESIDVVTRQAGIGMSPLGVPVSGPNNPTGNRLYVLAGSAPSVGAEPAYQHSSFMLFTTADTANWSNENLIANLPNLNLMNNSSVGPISLEVVRTSNSATHTVYVAYSNAAVTDSVNDQFGLCVASASQNAGGFSAWTSPVSAGLIDGEFSYAGHRQHPTNDLIELRVKPEGKVSDNQFEKLGCAYITADGRLVLSETVGSGPTATWQKILVGNDPNFPDAIDRGLFRWVKLGYFDGDGQGPLPAKAYVFYCIRTSQVPLTYATRLWIQP